MIDLEDELRYATDEKHRSLVDRNSRINRIQSRFLRYWLMILIIGGLFAKVDQAVLAWFGNDEGVSLFNWLMFSVSKMTWTVYGFRQKDLVLGFSSLGSGILGVIILLGLLK